MGNLKVSDLMTREPLTVSPDTNLLECVKKMVRKKTGSLIITNKKELLGIICDSDILWALTKKPKEDLDKINAIDISPKKIKTISPNTNIEEALKKMKKLKLERFPVIHEKKLVGVITVKDILNFHPEFYPELEEFAKIREQSRKLKAIEKTKDRKSIREGICEECGSEDLLYRSNGMLICESCLNN